MSWSPHSLHFFGQPDDSVLTLHQLWAPTLIVGGLSCAVLLYLRNHVGSMNEQGKSDLKLAATIENGKAHVQPDLDVNIEDVDFSDVKVSKLLIHPIKSCRGISVSCARYTPEGLQHDRILAVIDASSHKVVTARELPTMVLIQTEILEEPDSPSGDLLRVSFPEESGYESFAIPLEPTVDVLSEWHKFEDIYLWGRGDLDGYICQATDTINNEENNIPSETISRFLKRDVYLVRKGPRPRPCEPTLDFPNLKATFQYQDGYPLLVCSEESLRAVQERTRVQVGVQGVDERWKKDELVMERFRPNIVVRGAGIPWAEDMWENVKIGENDSTISLVSKCTRCLLPNVDPETGIRDKAVPYKVLMKFRTGFDPELPNKACFGCNGVPDGFGAVRVGDPVRVMRLAGSSTGV